MMIRLLVWSAAVCLALTGQLSADISLPFQENWNHQTPGDNASQLTWWSYESAYGSAPHEDGTVVHIGGGDNVLNMNPRGSEHMGIRSHRAEFGGQFLSIQSDIQLTTDGNGAGVMGFSQDAFALNGYILAVSRDGNQAKIKLTKYNGDLYDAFEGYPAVSVPIDPTQRYTYRLQAAFGVGQIAFSTYINGQHLTHPNLNPVDTSPHGFQDGVRFVLASNYGQQAYFDNIEAVPEPASMVVLGLGLAGCVLRRRRR